MTRHAILQIGTEKTGTTTLQQFLARNRGALATRGYVYPRFCGEHNHTGLAAYALDAGKQDDIRAPFGVAGADDVPAMRQRLREAAANELDGSADAIFCSEHCHSRLTGIDEVARLRDFLFTHFDEVRVSVYLRRQDQVALSLYSTRLKSGGVESDILPKTNASDPYFNYARSLALWEQCFGPENMRVRLFDRTELVGGSVIDDFLASWDLGAPGGYADIPNANESILPVAQEYLRLMNRHLEPTPAQPIGELRGALAAALSQLYPGAGARPSRGEAEAFLAMFAESNEIIRRRYFPDRRHLFSPDFGAYPDRSDNRGVTLDEICGVAARIHALSSAEKCRLEAEIAVRDARLHWQAENSDAAISALRRAVDWRPQFGEAYRILAAYLLTLERLDEACDAAEHAVRCKPDCDEYWHFVGLLRRRLGDPAGAAERQRKALVLNPDSEGARRELDLLQAAIPEDMAQA